MQCIRRMNCHTIANCHVHPSVCLSFCLGQVCIVIIRCTLAQFQVYGWIVQCSGHPDTKAGPCTPNHFFQFHQEERWGMDVQARRSIVYVLIILYNVGIST